MKRLINFSKIFKHAKLDLEKSFMKSLDNKIKSLICSEISKLSSISDRKDDENNILEIVDKYYEVPLVIQKSPKLIKNIKSINRSSIIFERSSLSIGLSGEKYVEQVFKLNNIKYKYTGNINHMGDYHINKDNGDNILVEVKNYKNNVDIKEVNKFIDDLNNNKVSGGIFISLRSPINHLDKKKYNYFNQYNLKFLGNSSVKLIKLNKNIPILFIQAINVENSILSSSDILSGVNIIMDMIGSLDEIINPDDILDNLRNISTGSKLLDNHLNNLLDSVCKFIKDAKLEVKNISLNNYEISKKIYNAQSTYDHDGMDGGYDGSSDILGMLNKYNVSSLTDLELLQDIIIMMDPYDELLKNWKKNRTYIRNGDIIIKFQKKKSIILNVKDKSRSFEIISENRDKIFKLL